MKKLICFVIAVLLCLVLFAGCSAKNSDLSETDVASAAPSDAGGFVGENEMSHEEFGPDRAATGGGSTAGMKIIYSCTLTIETLKYDDSLAAILADLKAMDGYVSSSQQYGGSGARHSYLTLRIPAGQYDAFLAKAGDYGTVTSRGDSTQDITAQYIDVEARLTSLKAQEARLLELVNTASDLESLILLEEKLGEIRYEIESFQSTLNTYDNLVDFCTVDISLYEVSIVSPVTAKTFGQQIKDAFTNSWYAIVAFLRGFVLVLITLLPFLVLVGLILFIVLRIVKKTRPRRLERRAQKQAALFVPPPAGNPYGTPPANPDQK